jgi:glutamyl-tRNA reductase
MHILVVGLNYRTAPVEIREKFAFAEADIPEALQRLKATPSLLECVVVGTCNRTEIYAVVDRVKWCGSSIIGFMEAWFGIPKKEIIKHIYSYENERAIEHLFRVSCGLDSMIIGETQILGQVRDAFLKAQQEKATGTIFNTLFKQAVTLAKKAHSDTSIGENPVSVSYAAVELGKRIFGHFDQKNVMIVGAGKMSELTGKHLHANGAEQIVVVNRTLGRAKELAAKLNGKSCSIEYLQAELEQADIVISSTGSSELVLTRTQVEAAMSRRKSRPLFMIDIAVPRDLDPGIGDLPNVYLYDIDDLQNIVESNLAGRREEAKKIEQMIDVEIMAFDHWYKTLGVSPLIKALQEKAGTIHEDTIASMMNKLPDLSQRELQVIRKLTKSMLNQMMRDPIVKIKELAAEKNGEEALKLFTELFSLEEAPLSQEAAKPALSLAVRAESPSPSAQREPAAAAVTPAGSMLKPNELLAGT